ncbi:MAG TPA: hypothetical protein DHM90_11445 [Clostridiaceae bacterium]|nr:hypothetical protein [Clostridiaceae bacterium]
MRGEKNLKNKKIFLISVLVLSLMFILFLAGSGHKDNPSPIFSSDYEHNYFVIREKVQKKYSLESRHIKVISRDTIDDISFVLFTFMDDNYSYIGDLSYISDSEEETKIKPDTIISLNVHPVNDSDTPFTVRTSMITENQKEYCFYYGWINNMHIDEIDFDFSDQSVNVDTQGKKYYSLLRNRNQKTEKIAAFDLTHTVIHEFKY